MRMNVTLRASLLYSEFLTTPMGFLTFQVVPEWIDRVLYIFGHDNGRTADDT